jgi:Tfp pilus assembly major pilin PilA
MVMPHSFKSAQLGFSFLGMVFVAIVFALTGVITAQVVPTAIEYQAIIKAAQKASAGNTVVEVRALFDKAASIDNISSISGKDIDVSKENDKVVVKFSYQREIHLVGPAFLTLKYEGKSN